ncbi:MAG: nucleotide sugar dehydrogenase [Dehalococcoidales bacterium]|jgi:UDPglucose 6-dehydrogenase/UDP-N-acetyl-D-galactosamine dehydrogenase
MKSSLDKAAVCVIGLGYVGLPLAEAFAGSLKVTGYDTDVKKIKSLQENNRNSNLVYTSKAEAISSADFIIICVPTPVTKSKDPDLSYVESAATTAGQHMKKGSTVILESTVYPGVTEEIVKPILEKESGLKCGTDFKIGYSPERVNPGDKLHGVNAITKVVAGMDKETTERAAALYGRIAKDVFKATDIKTAEAAKVIENTQRDLNIALMNELTLIFKKMGLSTSDVLDAAVTKWNFVRFSPGLVGGHCIPVDPYYLVYKAKELGYHAQVIPAGRAINDYMPKYIAEMTIKALNNMDKVLKGSRVLIMGLTYKENVPDIRETPVREIIDELKEFGVDITGYDPLLENVAKDFGIKAVKSLKGLAGYDGVIVAVAHDAFKTIAIASLKGIMSARPVLIDVRGLFTPAAARKAGFNYWSLQR